MNDHAQTVAVITGGTQGLGLAIAERLIDEGCRQIIVAGRAVMKGEAAAEALRANGADVRFLPVDMAHADEAIALIDRAATRFGRVTALVNAAACTDRGGILDVSPEIWDSIMDVNAKGPFFALQRFAQRAVADGHPASAVNILSMSAHCGQSFLGPYSASKAALANITRNAAQALRSHRIRVNGVNAGWMDTPGEDMIQRKYHAATDGWLEAAEARQPFGSLVKPTHVAGLVTYLLGPGSGVMTGSVIDFDQNVAGGGAE